MRGMPSTPLVALPLLYMALLAAAADQDLQCALAEAADGDQGCSLLQKRADQYMGTTSGNGEDTKGQPGFADAHGLGGHNVPVKPALVGEADVRAARVAQLRAVVPSDVEFQRDVCWSADCPAGRLVADAWLAWCKAGCHFALVNSGSVRAGLQKGNVSRPDVQRVQPFQNFLVIVDMKGLNVLKMLQYGASQCNGGGFPQFAGVRLALGVTQRGPNGRCLGPGAASFVSAQICTGAYEAGQCTRWKTIRNTKTYRFVTNSWLAVNNGDGYAVIGQFGTLLDLPGANSTDLDAVLAYLESEPDLSSIPTVAQSLSNCTGNSGKEGWELGCRIVETTAQPDAQAPPAPSPAGASKSGVFDACLAQVKAVSPTAFFECTLAFWKFIFQGLFTAK